MFNGASALNRYNAPANVGQLQYTAIILIGVSTTASDSRIQTPVFATSGKPNSSNSSKIGMNAI